MERLTKYITPVGTCMTTLNRMKHYMPCVPCRKKAPLKTRANGEMYTEKHSYCDTCEVKMLFNRLKEYEDAEEQGLLIRLPCKVGDDVWTIMCGMTGKHPALFRHEFTLSMFSHFGTAVFLTKEEAEKALAEMEK